MKLNIIGKYYKQKNLSKYYEKLFKRINHKMTCKSNGTIDRLAYVWF